MHKRAKDFTGVVFGRLTCVEPTPLRIAGNVVWKCQCSCGNITHVSTAHLGKKPIQSCGCLVTDRNGLPYGEAHLNRMYGAYQESAAKRGLPFEMTRAYFETLVLQECHYCGAAPRMAKYRTKSLLRVVPTNGLDRRNNDEGYTENNCVPCCSDCNFMKHTLSAEEFILQAQRIVLRHSS